MSTALWWVGGGLAALWGCATLRRRLELSAAKHPSLRGHARWAQRLARWLPYYEFGNDEFFGCDGAPAAVQQQRQQAFAALAQHFARTAPRTLAASAELEGGVSDVQFVGQYRVPFPFRRLVRQHLRLGCVAAATKDRRIADLDGNWSLDLTGSYGVNLFGHEFYKHCIAAAVVRAEALGPVLGPYHPVLVDNVRRLKALSGMDEVSFHMSGTEAVMQAVRLARYHTGRSHVVRFCGAYHGWWDGVQAGVGNPRPPHEVYTLRDLDERSLRVLRTRRDIACVLVNPLQALHPNQNAPSDSMLLTGERRAAFDKAGYAAWLRRLRQVCTERGIALVFDDVFLGFRLAPGGSQEYFGVAADLVTYGKTLGGGLPVGVVCGKAAWMRRFRPDRPSDICFARGTFNSHPYVMAAMDEFLRHLERPEVQQGYQGLDALWDGRAQALNERLAAAGLPVRVANLVSVWTTLFTQPGRYHWMLQYYLRRHGIAVSWVGSGRLIFSHDCSELDYRDFADRFVAAAQAMAEAGWWWSSAATTGKALRRRMLRETVAAWFGRRRAASPAPAAAPGGDGDEIAPGTVAARVGGSA
jgi:glutamate-1-semialdehyde 2,1-aminomutase